MKEAAKRHHDRKPRLAAYQISQDEVKSVTPPRILMLMATYAIEERPGELEGSLGRLGRYSLRGREKVGIK